jgi:ParB/RepB/Spo0J family partition protein
VSPQEHEPDIAVAEAALTAESQTPLSIKNLVEEAATPDQEEQSITPASNGEVFVPANSHTDTITEDSAAASETPTIVETEPDAQAAPPDNALPADGKEDPGHGVDQGAPKSRPRRKFQLLEIPLDRIRPNHFNPRKHSGTAFEQLQESIDAVDMVQLPCVRQLPSGEYEIIDGEGRWQAALAAGWTSMYCVNLGVLSDKQADELQHSANAVRTFGLTAECKGLAHLRRQGVSRSELAKKFRLSETAVKQRVGIGSWPEDLLDMIQEEINRAEEKGHTPLFSERMLIALLPLRKKREGQDPRIARTLDDVYDYDLVRQAIKDLLAGKVEPGEKLDAYVKAHRPLKAARRQARDNSPDDEPTESVMVGEQVDDDAQTVAQERINESEQAVREGMREVGLLPPNRPTSVAAADEATESGQVHGEDEAEDEAVAPAHAPEIVTAEDTAVPPTCARSPFLDTGITRLVDLMGWFAEAVHSGFVAHLAEEPEQDVTKLLTELSCVRNTIAQFETLIDEILAGATDAPAPSGHTVEPWEQEKARQMMELVERFLGRADS